MSAAASSPGSTTGEHRLLTYRVERIEEALKEAVGDIRDAIKSIDKTLQVLSVVEAQHAATRELVSECTRVIKRQSGQLKAIELELPTLRLVRTWVIAGVIGVVAAVGVAVVGLVVR